MRAFIVDGYRKTGALRLGEMPEPTLRDDDVLVEIHASGLNVLDSKIRDGEFKLILPYRPPFVLGHDVAGTVVRIGSKVRRFKPGDEIYARPRDGRVRTFAERVSIDEAYVALKPKNLSMEEAASIPLVSLMAWQALVEEANLRKGQKILIHAGSGGVGTLPFSWRRISVQRSRRRRARRMSTWSGASARMSSSTRSSKTSRRSSPAMTSSFTAWTAIPA
jgi:NADPH:quinone reductase-like Zn-dependent oxidoreductase